MMRLEQPRAPLETPERLPRRPGPTARRVVCRVCGNFLGDSDGGRFFAFHRGREMVSHLPAEVKCEDCGKYTRVELT